MKTKIIINNNQNNKHHQTYYFLSSLGLKFTKEEAGGKIKAILEDLSKKMSPDMSYKSIRDILHNGAPPALPYLGKYY